MRTLLKNALLHFVFPVYYRFRAAVTRVDNLVVFVEIRYSGLSNNLKRLYEAYLKNGNYRVEQGFLMFGAKSMWVYVRHCFSVIRQIAGARFVFVDDSSNMLAALPIREETQIVQTWHACGAFKRFGHGLKKELGERFYNEYALVTVSSDKVTGIFKNAMLQSKDSVKAIGVSRTDAFFDEVFLAGARKRVRECCPALEGKKSILYAPTFRGNAASAREPEHLDIGQMYEALSEEYVVLYKAHPLVKERIEVPESCRTFFLDVSDLLAIEELLPVCDLCITDYSSLIFEYSLFERPMVFYAGDYDSYCEEQGFYFPYRDFVPGAVCGDTAEVICAILHTDDGELEKVRRFRREFMGACDGHSTERIVEYLEKL